MPLFRYSTINSPCSSARTYPTLHKPVLSLSQDALVPQFPRFPVSRIVVVVIVFEKSLQFSRNETYSDLSKELARCIDTHVMYGYVNVCSAWGGGIDVEAG